MGGPDELWASSLRESFTHSTSAFFLSEYEIAWHVSLDEISMTTSDSGLTTRRYLNFLSDPHNLKILIHSGIDMQC